MVSLFQCVSERDVRKEVSLCVCHNTLMLYGAGGLKHLH